MLALAAGAALPLGASGAAGRPLRLIVPAPAAGSTDFIARILAEGLRSASVPAVVVNKPGVAGTLAVEALLAAPQDGTTFLLSPNSVVTEMPYTVRPRYDPFTDLVPLAELASVGIVLVAHPQLPVRTLAEMVAYARERPGQLAYASFGPGTISHVKGLQLATAARLDMLHVGYRGSPPALQDVLAGHVPFMFDGIPTSAPHVKSQRLRALAVSSPERSPVLEGIPTFAESGFAGLTQTMAISLFATPGIDAAAASLVRRQVLEALDPPGVRAALGAAGMHVASQQPTTQQMRQAMRIAFEQNGDVLRSIRYVPSL